MQGLGFIFLSDQARDRTVASKHRMRPVYSLVFNTDGLHFGPAPAKLP